MSLSLNCSPAYWSPAPAVEFGVACPARTFFSPSDKLSDLPSRLCCYREPIWFFLIDSSCPTVLVVAMLAPTFPFWWLDILPLTLSYSRFWSTDNSAFKLELGSRYILTECSLTWLEGMPWCDLGFLVTGPVTEPNLLPPLGLSISTELLNTSTEWPRFLAVAGP
jgi:hypothetical protein